MKRWVERQARGGRYGNASDYVRDLIRQEQEREGKIVHMHSLVDEASASGPSDVSMAARLVMVHGDGLASQASTRHG